MEQKMFVATRKRRSRIELREEEQEIIPKNICDKRRETIHHSNNNNNKKKRTMKLYIYSIIATSLLIIILLQLTSIKLSEAKKIKIKDLKKAKKYAYLLATQRKKFYAIPVPLPLPVFVKRQQIYTQVPIVPRYVHQPATSHQQHHQHYYSYDSSPSSYDPYSSSSNSPYASSSSSYEYGGASSPYHTSSSPYPSTAMRYNLMRYNPMMMGPAGLLSSPLAGFSSQHNSKSKYLTSLANALGQAYPVLGNAAQGVVAGNGVVGKLLSGQAKVLPPSQIKSILFNSKPVNGAATYKQQHETQEQQQDKDSDSSSESSKSQKDSGSSSTSNSTASNNNKDNQDKPSASEAIYSTINNPYLHHRQLYANYPYLPQPTRIMPTFVGALPHHYHHQPIPLPGHQTFGPLSTGTGAIPNPASMAAAANELMQLMAAAASGATAAADGSPYGSTTGLPMNSAASDNPAGQLAAIGDEATNVLGLDGAITNQQLLASEQMQLQESQQNLESKKEPTSDDSQQQLTNKTIESSKQKQLIQQQLDTLQRNKRQQAIKSALIRHKLEAQLAEANSFAIAAHELGLPLAPGEQQLRLINF